MCAISRREFLARSRNAGLGLAAGVTILGNAASVRGTPAHDKIIMAVVGMTTHSATAGPRMKVVRGEAASGPNLVRNPGFEELAEGRPVAWTNWQAGYQPAPGEGRDGSAAVTGREGSSLRATLARSLMNLVRFS